MIARGTIWWADLDRPVGSEPGFRRPVLVVSSDRFNTSRIGTVIVVALSSNLALADAPGNVLARSEESGLPKDSVVNVSQIRTISKARLDGEMGRLPSRLLDAVEHGLLMSLGLPAA